MTQCARESPLSRNIFCLLCSPPVDIRLHFTPLALRSLQDKAPQVASRDDSGQSQNSPEEDHHTLHSNTAAGNTVCVGLDDGSVLVYGSMDTSAQCLLTIRNDTGCPVLCLKHTANFLFAGLRDGTLLIYERHTGGKSYIRT
ncbi:hypothetical protein AOLI_G00249290 [Acnodon oligacanthus]